MILVYESYLNKAVMKESESENESESERESPS